MIKFGTGGWRAVIGEEFICENIRRVALGICGLMKKYGKDGKPVIIGFDRRFLSLEAAKWMAEVFCKNGISVFFLNRSAPTPLIMHTVKKKGLYFGVEITASHNPSRYNGIKLIVEEGRDAPLETTDELEKIIAAYNGEVAFMPFDEAVKSGMIKYEKNPFNSFIDDIIALLDMDAIKNHGVRILFDPMHGSSTYPLMVILYTARCTIDLINGNKDAYFGGSMPAPSEGVLGSLSDRVVAGEYDIGIAVDGDGDRLGIIDRSGKYISANEILVMLYYYLHEYKGWKGAVVRNLSTTHMLDKVAASFNEKCYEVPVGFKYISSKIDEVDAVLGGESSGGLTVRGHIHGKDSIYAASLFVEMLCALNKTPSEIYSELETRFGTYRMVEDNLSFRPEQKPQINKVIMIEKRLPDFGSGIVRVNYEDGCKVYFEDDSFVICRFSGTEPLLRIFAEAGNEETASGYIKAFKSFLEL